MPINYNEYPSNWKTEIRPAVLERAKNCIEGMLRYHKGKKIRILEDDNGRRMSDKEARTELAKLQALGHKLMPCGECEGFDPFEKGCPGHPIEEPISQEPPQQQNSPELPQEATD